MSGNRAIQRHRTFKAGSIAFSGATIDCTVRNLTNHGAMLEVESPIGIPREFVLVIGADGFQRSCRLVWVKHRHVGVAFLEP